ncbi:MAG: hypothetical protein NZL87_05205, partial [Thermomicrobium sp.]|nr:hypothetical protein [Thermomicrobium sp.]
MARPGFYNDNLARWYPFLPPSPEDPSELATQLPKSAIVDAFAIFSARSQFSYRAVQGGVFLVRVSRAGPILQFEFQARTYDESMAPSPPLHQTSIVFCRHIDDPLYAADYRRPQSALTAWMSESLSESFSYPVERAASEPLWHMHLVSGDMQELAERLSNGQVWTGRLELLPSLIQSLA